MDIKRLNKKEMEIYECGVADGRIALLREQIMLNDEKGRNLDNQLTKAEEKLENEVNRIFCKKEGE